MERHVASGPPPGWVIRVSKNAGNPADSLQMQFAEFTGPDRIVLKECTRADHLNEEMYSRGRYWSITPFGMGTVDEIQHRMAEHDLFLQL